MDTLQMQQQNYLKYCEFQKRLDNKTIKAYRIDLTQFANQIGVEKVSLVTPSVLETYIMWLHQMYKAKTVKRKLASVKSFFHYLEYKDVINNNPFNKIQIKFREPVILPKTIPLHTIELLLKTIYQQRKQAHTIFQRENALRDAAMIELLFATGMRISELCSLQTQAVNLEEQTVLIYGKGSKERRIQIGNEAVVRVLREYEQTFCSQLQNSHYFFVNHNGTPVSDQAIRRMINKYTSLAAIEQHITPHMFRHTFATSLLEADVDIRYIQEMLGHSSINVTEIYTHVAMAKQRDILTTKHPRKDFCL